MQTITPIARSASRSLRAPITLVMLAGTSTVLAQAFYPLGTAAGFNDSNGTAISADGLSILRVSAKYEFPLGLVRKIEKVHAPWSAPTFLELAQPDAAFPSSDGVALNLNGSQAAGSGPIGNDSFLKGLTWTDPGTTPSIGNPGPGLFEEYSDMTASGSAVVGTRTSLSTYENQPFFKGPTGLTNLPLVPGYVFGTANAVNGDGTVVAGTSQTNAGLGYGGVTSVAVKWSGDLSGFPVELGYLSADPSINFSEAFGVSGDGTTTVGQSSSGNGYGSSLYHPFRHTDALGMQDLFLNRFDNGAAVDASFDGNVVVGNRFFGDGQGAPWVWVPWRGARDIADVLSAAGVDLSGYSLFSCSSVSDDGRTVTGNAYSSVDGFQIITWVAVLPIDCPSDYDGDGFVTGEDFDAFVAAFENGDLSADFNGDGFITGEDFDGYVAAFESGC